MLILWSSQGCYLRTDGWKEGRKEGRKEGKQAGRQAGRQEGGREGWREGRKEGMKEGRKEGRTEGSVTISLRNFVGEGIIRKNHSIYKQVDGRFVHKLLTLSSGSIQLKTKMNIPKTLERQSLMDNPERQTT